MTSRSSSTELERFRRFAALVGLNLEPFQLRIAEAVFGPEREAVVLLPRGQGKSTLVACLTLFHLLTHPEPRAYVGAASREQARAVFEPARAMARHPAVAPHVTVRHLELRTDAGHFRVLASDGNLAHGLTPTWAVADELWAHRGPELLEAFQTGLVKRPDSKLVVISTAANHADTPLGRLRTRALAQPSCKRGGVLTEATGSVRLLEWSLTPAEDAANLALVKACNPATWVTTAALERQRDSLPLHVFGQFHANQWGRGDGAWLPPGAWAACQGDCSVPEGSELWLGIDVGGSRASSALVGVTEDLKVAEVHVWQGDDAVLKVTDKVHELAEHYAIREVIADPWRYRAELLRLERDLGLTTMTYPQTAARMVPASEGLHRMIVSGELTHPAHPDLDRHVASAVARHVGRGWRLDKADREAQIDSVIALALAADRATWKVPPAQLVGFL